MGSSSVIPQALMPWIPRGPARFPALAAGQPRLRGPPLQVGTKGTGGPQAEPCPLPMAGCHRDAVVRPVREVGMGIAARCFALSRTQGAELQCSGWTLAPRPPEGDACPRGMPTLMDTCSQ